MIYDSLSFHSQNQYPSSYPFLQQSMKFLCVANYEIEIFILWSIENISIIRRVKTTATKFQPPVKISKSSFAKAYSLSMNQRLIFINRLYPWTIKSSPRLKLTDRFNGVISLPTGIFRSSNIWRAIGMIMHL